MREFSIVDIAKYYFKNLALVLIAVILFFGLGQIYVNNFYHPTYKESATIILGKSNDEKIESEMSYSTITFYDSLINNYLKLLDSNKVLNDVRKNLDLEYSIGQLRNMIDYSVTDSSQIIEISVKNQSDKLAVEICNEIVDVLKKHVYEIYAIDNISTIDKATTKGNVIYSKALVTLGFTALGFILSSFLIVLKFIFTNKMVELKTSSNPEINVLGKILYRRNLKEHKLEKELDLKNEDSFRNIRSNVFKNEKNTKVIMISSIYKNNVSSYITYNLGKSYQKTNKKVLVIDANKNGIMTSTFLPNKQGLLDLLKDASLIEKIKYKIDNIDILPLGNIEYIDLISSDEFTGFISYIKKEYDYIFIECSEFNNNFEPISILKVSDALILVSSFNTKAKDIINLKEEVKNTNTSFLGMIIVSERKSKKNKKKTKKKSIFSNLKKNIKVKKLKRKLNFPKIQKTKKKSISATREEKPKRVKMKKKIVFPKLKNSKKQNKKVITKTSDEPKIILQGINPIKDNKKQNSNGLIGINPIKDSKDERILKEK